MKRNPFSKSTISFEQQKEISEKIRSIVYESWSGIKASSIHTPQSLLDEDLIKSDSDYKKK